MLIDKPILLIVVILVTAVIMINGWTDAPNAIATCISTRAMTPKAQLSWLSYLIFGCISDDNDK